MKKLLLVFLLLAVVAQAGVLKMAAYPIRHSPVDTVKKVAHFVWHIVY